QHLAVDDPFGGLATRAGQHQHVDVSRHFDRACIPGITDAVLPTAAVVNDLHAECLGTPCDRLADASEADDPHGAAGHLVGQRGAAFQPPPFAHETIVEHG